MLLLIFALIIPLTRQTSNLQEDEYDYLTFIPENGKFTDQDYKSLHQIHIDEFIYDSTGHRDSDPISNAFDEKEDTFWVSNQAESDSFHPSIFINFTSQTLFEAFIIHACYRAIGNKKSFDGFPSKIKVYSALTEEDPFTLRAVFTGTQMDESYKMQFVLSTPIICTRLKLEFHDVTIANSLNSNEKLASVRNIILFKNYGYDLCYHKETNGVYKDSEYLSLHATTNFTSETNGDHEGNNFTYALDADGDSSWISKEVQTDDFYPTIYINFTEQVYFEGLLYQVCSHKSGTKRVFDGFPNKLIIYSALDDEPFKIHTVFTGTIDYTQVQFILANPVKCTRIKIELHDVTDYKGKGKYAAADTITILKLIDFEDWDYQKVSGDYDNSQYTDFHKIPDSIMSIVSNGDYEGHNISHALDEDRDSYWQSSQPESETFHPTIYVNFTEPTLFEALAYDVKSTGTIRKYFGFPKKMLIYTALGDDEPFALKYQFKGEPNDPHMLVLLPAPINCTRMMFEFYDVMNIEGGDKYAQADSLIFYRNFEYEQINYQKVGGVYSDTNYVDFHDIPKSIISVASNGDYEGHNISYALDTDRDSYWQSSYPESKTFHPTIYVNFSEPTLFEALIYDVKSGGTIRKYYGFPEKVLLYTALDDEPMTPKVLFQGDTKNTKILFALSNPINCTRMMFEFYYITNIEKGDKYAQADGFHFFRSLQNEGEKFEKITGKYNDPYYINSHKVEDSKFVLDCNGYQAEHPISYVLNENTKEYWVSDKENSDDFHATITVNFTEPVLLEALLIKSTVHAENKVRQFDGFPLRLNVYSSYNNKPFKLNTKFAEFPLTDWETMQFVFPALIRCDKLKLEFVQVTRNYFSNNEQKASITSLKFISQPLIDYTNKNLTDDIDVFYVNDTFYLDEVVDTSFVDYMLPKQNDYLFVVERDFNFTNDVFSCTAHKAGAIESKLTAHIFINNCKFYSCTVKSNDENGGAINFINCGIVCEKSDFVDCKSTTGGKGGALYMKINSSITEDTTIKGCTFTGCTAYYGGGVFVYSNDKTKDISFRNCIFTSNSIINSNSNEEPCSGSALYLMTMRSSIIRCKFSKNSGPNTIKIVYEFQKEIENNRLILLNSNQNQLNSIIVDNCLFEINSDSKSSVSLIHKSDLNAQICFNNCVFNGKLAKNAHHIYGEIECKDKLQKLHINSCKFSSDKKGALLLNSNGGSSYSFNTIVKKSDFLNQKSSKENKTLLIVSLVMLGAALVVSVVVVVIVKIQKNSISENDELHKKIEI